MTEIIFNPDILPTLEEWRLICTMVKQQRELTDEEIEEVFQENIRQPNFMMLGDTQRFARAILKKASEQ